MWIKIIIIAGIAAVTVVLLRSRGSKMLALRRLAMVVFGMVFAASVLFQDVWTVVANAVGVGRGADLLLYMFVLVMLFFVAATHLHFRGVEAQVTLLARRLALAEATPAGEAARTGDQSTEDPQTS
ncbi:MAG: DUF2304 domain-containing protein [Micrococcales bacterium]|nr:DUF2304 domain-containing protein [Micrococcales bacterium]MCL2668513.1 DUF2304 domain-containing protein [Micrococcales bacterium]